MNALYSDRVSKHSGIHYQTHTTTIAVSSELNMTTGNYKALDGPTHSQHWPSCTRDCFGGYGHRNGAGQIIQRSYVYAGVETTVILTL